MGKIIATAGLFARDYIGALEPELIPASVALNDEEHYSPGWESGPLALQSLLVPIYTPGEKQVRLSVLLKDMQRNGM
jgi:hypothetical protein